MVTNLMNKDFEENSKSITLEDLEYARNCAIDANMYPIAISLEKGLMYKKDFEEK